LPQRPARHSRCRSFPPRMVAMVATRTAFVRWLAAVVAGAMLTATAAAASIDVPGAGPIEKVDFERHIMGLFGKMGCNSGSCHGSFQARNGFRLSLFGYDPVPDLAALTRDNLGRRIDPV